MLLSSEEIEQIRQETLEAISYTYLEMLKLFELDQETIIMDAEIVNHVLDRFLRDTDRFRVFHGSKRLDRHKDAGYLTYWICKLKPLQVKENEAYSKRPVQCKLINELLALVVSVGRIQASKSVRFNLDFQNSFLYTLKYRSTNPDTLSLLYYLMEEAS